MEVLNHVLMALVPLLAYCVVRYRRLPSGGGLLVVVFASLFPDVVDKPLAWGLGVIPSGRMLAHSLVIAIPLLTGVVLLSARSDRLSAGLVFTWGYLSHLVGDFYPVLWQGAGWYWYPNLFWPLMEAHPDRNPGFGSHFPWFGIESVYEWIVIGALLAYLVYDLRRRRLRLPAS